MQDEELKRMFDQTQNNASSKIEFTPEVSIHSL